MVNQYGIEQPYNLYCEFDIEQHKKHYPNYLEVLIEQDGHVVYAIPSHQEKAIELACEAKGWTRKELEDACPHEYYGDFLTWLLMQCNAISVWNNFFMGTANDAQKQKLEEMRSAGIYRGEVMNNPRRGVLGRAEDAPNDSPDFLYSD